MALIGYARVSTTSQEVAGQHDALHQAGCVRVFTDRVSGASRNRPELGAALDRLEPGDVLVVWRLDRLGRSLSHLIETVQGLNERGVHFRSLTEALDTTTAGGRLLFHVAGAFAQFERDLVRERTMVGLEAARAAGRVGGRPRVMTPEKLAAARGLLEQRMTQDAVAASLGVSVRSLRRALSSTGR